MASYGKIATAQKRVIDSSSTLSDKSAWMEYQGEMGKIQETANLRNQILSNLGSVASGFDTNKESYQNLSTGATEAGVEGISNWDELKWTEQMKIGLGFGLTDKMSSLFGESETVIEDLDSTYKGSDGHYSTASLMEIGRKSRAGTLKGSLIGADNKPLSLYDLYGQDKAGDEGVANNLNKNVSSDPSNSSSPTTKQTTKQGFDWTSLGIGDGKSQVLEFGGKLLGGAAEHLGMLDQEGLFRKSNRNWTGIRMGTQHGVEKSGSPYHLSNLWDTMKKGDYLGKKGWGE